MTEIGESVAPPAVTNDSQQEEEEKDYELEWSREHVIPENVLKPGDVEALFKLKVTKGSLTGPEANLVILSADDGPSLSCDTTDVKVSGGKLQGADGKDAQIHFEVKHAIWQKFDKLQYHFGCSIDTIRRQTAKAIKVKRWHVQAIDMNPAEATAQLPYRVQEQANFLAAFTGADDDKESHSFVADSGTLADFGSWMMNTYSFVYTGHGCVLCKACGTNFDSDDGTTDAQFGTWTHCSADALHSGAVSTFCIGPWATPPALSFFHAAHSRDTAIVKVPPRYLVFSVACGGAFESSLFDSFIARGTRYGIGFQKSTRCDWARDYAQSFFNTWAGTHKCDPDKIPTVFDGLDAAWGAKLAPSLFGRYLGLGSRLRELGRSFIALF